jgi:hypothetical protein
MWIVELQTSSVRKHIEAPDLILMVKGTIGFAAK